MDDPVLTAHELVRDRFPAARTAFLAGSVVTDRRTPTSDLDIVVVLDGPPAPYRENLVYHGWPVELFVQTEATWHDFADQETAKRNSPLLAMCSVGILLVDMDGLGASLQAEARRRWAAGPPPLTAPERDRHRYSITDLLDDLRGCGDPAERVYLVSHMLQRASEIALLTGGHWIGGGKWLSRRLAVADPGLHSALTEAAEQAVAGHTGTFAAVVSDVLDQAGGPLWDGYTVR
ncbi:MULTISPECIES: nucleotidyltransferase domain-containing protein [unclassified Streptomyces]|uniref:nucleotidyltransferase domain-containing protein n=1 Tax=unclassified Streptomyces TaxID=2593676 RepID=UPI0001C1BAF4|nr:MULTISPECIES: nucleotidyltransferase domain-containing protein [unclassified Streptomyces]AEN08041.1 DNA polymerase beta domain protein region [Streptomyces sp. SirexAA-E]MYR68451.1 nucleotidyltransferase domain-containing protein [Streptomyces sp. SID4939]MYS04668.1 nucleotidyltransferase domain-containing protein [Streptomyces sp. SID4940]MYT66807.1 nucleotidyltransferase domain-containing protein [Streptomyces sp. SID8357]MYT83728.1 nucleotidyltransferase domain-containing protein [Strep